MSDGSGLIFQQVGVDLKELADLHAGDGFIYCNGVMGVPITFLDKYCPEQFEIVAFRHGEDGKDLVFTRERESSTILSHPCSTSIPGMIKNAEGKINGEITYARITVKRCVNL